jgi:hypothetical protein
MPLPRSDTTHVSDSEPEREAHQLNDLNSSSSDSSAPDTPLTKRAPLSGLSGNVLSTDPGTWRALNNRLSAIVGDLAKIKIKFDKHRCHSAFD